MVEYCRYEYYNTEPELIGSSVDSCINSPLSAIKPDQSSDITTRFDAEECFAA